MFKLLKILNSKSSAPEIISVPTEDSINYTASFLYYIENGRLMTSDHAGVHLKFIPIESTAKNSGIKSIRGFIVTSDMIFDATVFGEYIDFGVGDNLSLFTNDDGHIEGVEALEGQDVKVISDAAFESTGKISIMFNCN